MTSSIANVKTVAKAHAKSQKETLQAIAGLGVLHRAGKLTDEEYERMLKELTSKVGQAAPSVGKEQKGSHGLVFGFSVVAVLRAMGKAGWDVKKAHTVICKASDSEVSMVTVHCQVGGWEYRGAVAPLTSAQWKELNRLAA